MKRMLAAVCVLALVGADKAEEKKGDELQGSWKVVSIARDGGAPQPPPEAASFIFMPAGKVISLEGGTKKEATYTIDPTKKPKHHDVIPSDGKTLKMVYVLDGDTLTLCGNNDPEGPRPTEVSSKKDSGQWILILKREKK
jgi:uncharacterized protein (TIGR03067 family)